MFGSCVEKSAVADDNSGNQLAELLEAIVKEIEQKSFSNCAFLSYIICKLNSLGFRLFSDKARLLNSWCLEKHLTFHTPNDSLTNWNNCQIVTNDLLQPQSNHESVNKTMNLTGYSMSAVGTWQFSVLGATDTSIQKRIEVWLPALMAAITNLF